MSEELEKLKEAMTAVGGHLQDLESEQSATVRELGSVVTTVGDLRHSVESLQHSVNNLEHSVKNLEHSVKNLQSRSVQMEAATVALGGTFASIEQILTTLLADQERVDKIELRGEALEKTVHELARRVEALEKRAS
ncbi:MAG: hypothetical protein HY319_28195 [Armatimonadetes bacterium]|nr:hypothetical protein [Armatimonadota bacterium]